MEWVQTCTSNLADCDIGTLAEQFHAVEDLLWEHDSCADTIQVNKRGGQQRAMREMVSPEHPRWKGQQPQCSYIPPYGDWVDGPFKALTDPDGNSQRTSISCKDSCRDIMSSLRCYSSNELVMGGFDDCKTGCLHHLPFRSVNILVHVNCLQILMLTPAIIASFIDTGLSILHLLGWLDLNMAYIPGLPGHTVRFQGVSLKVLRNLRVHRPVYRHLCRTTNKPRKHSVSANWHCHAALQG